MFISDSFRGIAVPLIEVVEFPYWGAERPGRPEKKKNIKEALVSVNNLIASGWNISIPNFVYRHHD